MNCNQYHLRSRISRLSGEGGKDLHSGDEHRLRIKTRSRNREKRQLDGRAPTLPAGRLARLSAGLALLVGLVEAEEIRKDVVTATPATPPSLHVEMDHEAVSIKAHEVSVRELLEEIGRRCGLMVDLHGSLEQRVTLELDRLPLREALDRILRGRNFILRHAEPSPGSSNDALPSRLWVFSTEPGEHPRGSHSGDDRSTCDGYVASGALEAHACLEQLNPDLVHDDETVRLAAVSVLAAVGGAQSAAAALAAVARFDADGSVREEAVYGLGEIGDEIGLQILEQALLDPDLRVREAAVDAIVDIGGDESTWALASALNDEVASLREQAVYALGDIGGGIAITILQQALADEQIFIREAAAEALDDLSSQDR